MANRLLTVNLPDELVTRLDAEAKVSYRSRSREVAFLLASALDALQPQQPVKL
jgi:metal-responsive CopG/Arc/MetJ family transcriptional regulator